MAPVVVVDKEEGEEEAACIGAEVSRICAGTGSVRFIYQSNNLFN
jgi:hypothetical protein